MDAYHILRNLSVSPAYFQKVMYGCTWHDQIAWATNLVPHLSAATYSGQTSSRLLPDSMAPPSRKEVWSQCHLKMRVDG